LIDFKEILSLTYATTPLMTMTDDD